jgi:hypothetical protein
VSNAEIDEALERAARAPHAVQPELLKRIADAMQPTLVPVRPLPPSVVLAGVLVLAVALVALAGAARAGFQGFEALGLVSRVVIFAALALLACAAAGAMVAEWIPGSSRRLTAGGLLGVTCAALLGVFALLFHDYRTEHFVAAGLSCLFTGLLHATAAAVLAWWVLRRGFALNPVSAGLAAGVLGGLAGVTLLELHCPNFEALHVLIWHTLVVPASAAAGAALGWALRGRG